MQMFGNFGAFEEWYIGGRDFDDMSKEDMFLLGWEFLSTHMNIMKGEPFKLCFHRKNLPFIKKLCEVNHVEFKITFISAARLILGQENAAKVIDAWIGDALKAMADAPPDNELAWLPQLDVTKIPEEAVKMRPEG